MRDMVPLRAQGEVVGSIPADRCYRFRAAVGAARLAALGVEGRAMLGLAAEADEAPEVAPALLPAAVGVENEMEARVWRALESRGGIEFGDEVRPEAGDVIRGDRALLIVAGEVVAACATLQGSRSSRTSASRPSGRMRARCRRSSSCGATCNAISPTASPASLRSWRGLVGRWMGPAR